MENQTQYTDVQFGYEQYNNVPVLRWVLYVHWARVNFKTDRYQRSATTQLKQQKLVATHVIAYESIAMWNVTMNVENEFIHICSLRLLVQVQYYNKLLYVLRFAAYHTVIQSRRQDTNHATLHVEVWFHSTLCRPLRKKDIFALEIHHCVLELGCAVKYRHSVWLLGIIHCTGSWQYSWKAVEDKIKHTVCRFVLPFD